jgi:hypothetical protein
MNHYVYRITNKILNKHYYGVRSSDIEPKLDLGTKYFSSSTDSDFIKDQKTHPENFKYKIVRICETKEKALELEIKLHAKFNVGINESFYNRAKQTSTSFDVTGVTGRKLSPESKQKMSEAKQNMSPKTRQKMSKAKKGKEHTPEHKQKISEAQKGKEHSDETKLKMSEAHKGKKHSDETKQKLSEAKLGENNPMFGKEFSPEHKQKLSEANKGVPQGPQEIVQCPHCGKEGGISNMKRWHFDNCKYKEC